MGKHQRNLLILLRVGMGWLFFHAGIVKVMNPDWSAAGFLNDAQALKPLFSFLASPTLLPITNFVNEWALTALGASLILGLFVRLSAPLGALLMFFYYLPLGFPRPDASSYIVDQHVIYILALLYLGAANAGRKWGLDSFRGVK